MNEHLNRPNSDFKDIVDTVSVATTFPVGASHVHFPRRRALIAAKIGANGSRKAIGNVEIVPASVRSERSHQGYRVEMFDLAQQQTEKLG